MVNGIHLSLAASELPSSKNGKGTIIGKVLGAVGGLVIVLSIILVLGGTKAED